MSVHATPTRPLVIITRPRMQAQTLANDLKEQGFHSLIFPLLEIKNVQDAGPLDQALIDIAQFSLVIFVSPNAITAALNAYQRLHQTTQTIAWPSSVAIAVLGPGSLNTLASYGIHADQVRIISPHREHANTAAQFDSEALLSALQLSGFGPHQLSGQRILLVRGNGGRALLIESLQTAGAHLHIIEAYQRIAPKPDDALCKLLENALTQPHCWLLTSAEAVRNLHAIRQSHAHLLISPLGTALVSHPRIAAAAYQAGFTSCIDIGMGHHNLLNALHAFPLLRSTSI
ncbi:MAG: uroporphyrinogen-III synthase [Ottowia sp.]|nr:uroporphyrinogen-III synthase [Ottowia sp.]